VLPERTRRIARRARSCHEKGNTFSCLSRPSEHAASHPVDIQEDVSTIANFLTRQDVKSVPRYRVRPTKYDPPPLTRRIIPFHVSPFSSRHTPRRARRGARPAPPSHVTTATTGGGGEKPRGMIRTERLPLRCIVASAFSLGLSLSLSLSLSPSSFLRSLLDRLLDDFMPHKNDIKFVKTERCNDRTAWPYGVGAGG
jgi:hypothetical protein